MCKGALCLLLLVKGPHVGTPRRQKIDLSCATYGTTVANTGPHRPGSPRSVQSVSVPNPQCWPGRTGVRAIAFKAGFCTPKRSIGKVTKPGDKAGDPPSVR